MWSKITTKRQISEYKDLMNTINAAYAGTTVRGLNLILGRGGELFLYTSATYKIVLGFDILKNGDGNISIASPVGSYKLNDLETIAKIIIRKYRQWVDDHNIEVCKAGHLEEYGDKRLNRFHNITIPSLMHEFESEMRKDGQKVIIKKVFRRRSENKKDDEKFEGRVL